MSIVLVIIGLIIGGILTGQELIHAAAIRKQIKQLQDYQVAFNTFRTKYNCIPGDCGNATQFFGTTDPSGNVINNGNDSGLIDTNTGVSTNAIGVSATWSASTEIWGTLQQLSLAQMINYSSGSTITTAAVGSSVPSISLYPQAGFFIGANYNFVSAGGNPDITPYQKGTNVMWLTLCIVNNAVAMRLWDDNCGVFTALELQAIDQKVDDGMPLSGNFVGFGGFGATNTDCLNGSSYKISNATSQCQAAYVVN